MKLAGDARKMMVFGRVRSSLKQRKQSMIMRVAVAENDATTRVMVAITSLSSEACVKNSWLAIVRLWDCEIAKRDSGMLLLRCGWVSENSWSCATSPPSKPTNRIATKRKGTKGTNTVT